MSTKIAEAVTSATLDGKLHGVGVNAHLPERFRGTHRFHTWVPDHAELPVGQDDEAWGRWSKAQRKVEKEMLTQLQDEGVLPAGRLTWARKAGCSCGCSPAWVTKATVEGGNSCRGLDFFVTATDLADPGKLVES